MVDSHILLKNAKGDTSPTRFNNRHGATFQVSQLFSLFLFITKKFRLVCFYRMVTASNPSFSLEDYRLAFVIAIVVSLQRNQVT